MTPKQKKVSLNAWILLQITSSIGQMSGCLSNLREANPVHEMDIESSEVSEWMHIRDELQAVRVKLQELEPKFRAFAKFHPKSKWKRDMDKLIAQEELEKSNAT